MTQRTKVLAVLLVMAICLFAWSLFQQYQENQAPVTETTAGWTKYQANPVLGGNLGTVFDLTLLNENDTFRMWFSWRPKQSIAVTEGKDGINWSSPIIALPSDTSTGWENDVNRPTVIKRDGVYHMWYTGQTMDTSRIGYATSADGVNWTRMSDKPVLSSTLPWEKGSVMCPHVLWDDQEDIYKMWYSAGEQYEPDAIGYATSTDGRQWTKLPEPVFRPNPSVKWESQKVTGSQVIKMNGHYISCST